MGSLTTHQGSCLCEAVKFSVQGEPENTFMCYCKHCAKNAGGPGQLSAKYKKEQVQVHSGEKHIKEYILYDNLSGFPKHKVFCDNCGCTLWTIPMRHGGSHLIVRTALIENGLQLLPPKAEFFASRKIKWEGEVKEFDTMPGVKPH